MKKHLFLLASTCISLGLLSAGAQPGAPRGGMGGPQLSGPIGKLFGDNQSFSATMVMGITDQSGKPFTVSGKLAFDMGKSRFEVNLTDTKDSEMSPERAAQIKAMGLDVMVSIARPDQKAAYLIYPGMKSYARVEPSNPDSVATNSDFKMDMTEIGKETVDGHPCIKNKVIVTDKNGVQHESTVWNATDLKKFPAKIETAEQGDKVTMLFKDISLTRPAAGQFEPPADFKQYDSLQQMMQQEMMKRLSGGMGVPPH